MSLPPITFESLAATDQMKLPFTFGQPFAAGDFPAGIGLAARVVGQPDLPLQVDVKTTYPDGSVCHALISGIFPAIAAGAKVSAMLVPAKAGTVTPGALHLGFGTTFKATIWGVAYTASLDDLMKAGPRAVWLDGPTVTEWQVSTPLKAADGTAHPHLHVRFAVRWYEGAGKARIDTTVENDWAFEPNPQNFNYDAELTVGGKVVFSKAKMSHLHHAGWRKVFWLDGVAPALHVRQDAAYMIASGAVPNFEQIDIGEEAIADLIKRWQATNREPMGNGLTTPYMPTSGGRDDIGPMPASCVQYLLTQDPRVKEIILRNADLGASWSALYRDKNTDQPVSLRDYPYMTIDGRDTDTGNPKTGKREAFPWLDSKANPSPYTFDCSHQPNLFFLPYLITGDYFYLQMLQFWAMWNAFHTNPGYRENVRGLVNSEQLRGQAWALRSLFEAGYITPDKDSLKSIFVDMSNSNMDWYGGTYARGAKNEFANNLGIFTQWYSLDDPKWGVKTWQAAYAMFAVQRGVELGFSSAKEVAQWMARFQIRCMTDPEFDPMDAASYVLRVRDGDTGPVYPSHGEVWRHTVDPRIAALPLGSAERLAMRNALRGKEEYNPFQPGDIIGLANFPLGYVSNFQVGLAAAVDTGYPGGQEAWNKFYNRTTKPDYRSSPQDNILPRTVKATAMPTPAPTPAPAPSPAAPAPATGLILGAKPADGIAGTWVKIGAEGDTVKVAANAFLRYGAPGKDYVYAQATSTSVKADNTTFGRDPAVQVVKQVEVFKVDEKPVVTYKVGPVTRYQLTRLTTGPGSFGGAETIAQFDREDDANRARAALTKADPGVGAA